MCKRQKSTEKNKKLNKIYENYGQQIAIFKIGVDYSNVIWYYIIYKTDIFFIKVSTINKI